jgi:hypothetical protein
MLKIIFRLFKSRFLELAQLETMKPKGEGLVYAFTFKGKKWYTYEDLNLIPILRYGQFNRFMLEMQNCITRNEFDLITEAMTAALEMIASGRKAKGLAELTNIIEECNKRRTLLYHEEIWFRLASSLYVCEDENAHEWNETYEQQKAEMFKNDVAAFGGMHAFFTQAGWGRYIPSFEKLTSDFDGFIENQQAELETLIQTCERIIRINSASLSISNPSETN